MKPVNTYNFLVICFVNAKVVGNICEPPNGHTENNVNISQRFFMQKLLELARTMSLVALLVLPSKIS